MELTTDIKIVQGNEAWKELRTALQETYLAGIDAETTPVPWWHPDFRLLTVAIAPKPGVAYVVPISHAEGLLPSALQLIGLKNTIEEYNGTWVAQNGSFDHLILRKMGIDMGSWADTMVMEYLIDVERPKSLEALAKRYLKVEGWKDIDYKHPEEESLDVLARLNGRDADATLRLYAPMWQAVRDENLQYLYTDLLHPALMVLTDMEWSGVPVDMERLMDLYDKTEEDIDRLLEDIRDYTTNPKFNPNSFKQLGEFLYEELGLPCYLWTDTGKPSTSAEALRKVESLHPVVSKVLEYKRLRKLFTASLTPWLEQAQATGGTLHPRYKPAHVKTGRLASENPNIQQVPRGDVRAIFGGVEGHSVVEIDYSQIELRIMAWLSGDHAMLGAFEDGEDLHAVTARAFGVDRQTAKALNFGLLYGAGARKLRWIAEEQYGVIMGEERAESLRNQWFARHPSVSEFHAAASHEARSTGGVETAFGRWRPLPDILSPEPAQAAHAERQAINTPIQSVASDITLFKLSELWLALPDSARILATVHDSIILLVKDEDVDAVVSQARDILEDRDSIKETFGVEIGVPLVTEVKTGTHWA